MKTTITALLILLATATSSYAQFAQLCWSPADWPAGWNVEGYNVTVSDATTEPFTSVVTDAGLPALNSSNSYIFPVAIPADADQAARLRFTVQAYGRDPLNAFVKSQPSNSLDITCSEIGAVGGVNVCPTSCVPADADCDGRVTAADALLVLRIALGIESAPECMP